MFVVNGGPMKEFAWPGVVLILVVFFLLLFRRPIASFLSRATEFKGPKIGIRAEQAQDQVIKLPEPSAAEGLMRAFDSPALRIREDRIREDLQKRGLTEGSDVVNVLVRHLAAVQRAYSHQRIDRMIFGSQLEILMYLNTQSAPVPRDAVRGWYDAAAAAAPDFFKTYSFDAYLKFLSFNGLITDADGQLAITAEGRDLLVFLAETGATHRRPV
jgi:hypothetical protein